MKKILVPCDFSKPAIHAFRFALDVAAQSKGVLHLLHVIQLPVVHDTVLMPVLSFEEQLLKEMKEKSEAEFQKIIKKYNKDNIKVITQVHFGVPARTIVDYATLNAMDIIIMGSHGASGLREFFIGSNAEKIVRKSTVPVLVVKNLFKGSVENIIFPNALGDEDQEQLVERVKALQRFFKAKLHLVHINTPLNFTSDLVTWERLEEFARQHNLKDYTLNVFNHDDEESGILSFSKRIGGHLIAMGTHGRKGLAHLLSGSLTEDIVNHAENTLIWTNGLKREEPETEAKS